MPGFTSIEGSFDLCFSELNESMRELEHHYLIIKRNNLRLQAAMQQMQATFPQDHQVNDARVQALHKNAIHVVRYTMRDASNAMEIMQTRIHTRGNAVKRVVARLVERLSGQGAAPVDGRSEAHKRDRGFM